MLAMLVATMTVLGKLMSVMLSVCGDAGDGDADAAGRRACTMPSGQRLRALWNGASHFRGLFVVFVFSVWLHSILILRKNCVKCRIEVPNVEYRIELPNTEYRKAERVLF